MVKLEGDDFESIYRKMDIHQLADLARKGTAAKVKAEHTITEGETLSLLALKYYGKAARDYWMLIYETNKEAIGPNPGMIKPGTVLKIPELPEDMKE